MKNKISKFLAIAALATACLDPFCGESQAADQRQLTAYATGGTDVGTTLCYAVISANGRAQVAPVITFLNVTSDKATSVVQFYTLGSPTGASQTNATVSVPVGSTNTFVSGDVIVIQHLADDTYERRVLTTFTSSTNLTLTVAPTSAVVPGDLIYRATTAGFIPCGAATLSLTGSGIYSGQPGKPLLLEVDCTSAGQVNAVCAVYPQ
jgi:hypothetical protein